MSSPIKVFRANRIALRTGLVILLVVASGENRQRMRTVAFGGQRWKVPPVYRFLLGLKWCRGPSTAQPDTHEERVEERASGCFGRDDTLSLVAEWGAKDATAVCDLTWWGRRPVASRLTARRRSPAARAAPEWRRRLCAPMPPPRPGQRIPIYKDRRCVPWSRGTARP